MQSLLQRKLLIVTGKGGVGKTTIAGAIGMLAAKQGLNTIVLDLTGASARLRELFAHNGLERSREAGRASSEHAPKPQRPAQLAERLCCASIDPDQALLDWLQALGGRMPARMLASRASFQYFAAAAPGAKELICMVRVCELAGLSSLAEYDLVVLDAPATGHALAMLASPQTFASIARVGPIAQQARQVQEMLANPSRTGYLAVAQASEMAVAETIDLQRELTEQLRVELSCVIVNATMHRRFTGEELERIASLRGEAQADAHSRVSHAAAAAAEAAHARTRFQHSQVARLRRHGLSVLQVPLVFTHELDFDALSQISQRLEGKL